MTAKQVQKFYDPAMSGRVVGNDQPRKHKFNARRTSFVWEGKKLSFPSKAQATRYQWLLMMEKSGQIKGLRREVPVDLTVGGRKVCRMVWDAVYVQGNRTIYEDVKGATKTVAYRLFCIKRDLFLALFPNVSVVEVIGGKVIKRT